MSRLIVGHASSSDANIWVRGEHRYHFAFVTVTGPGKNQTKKMELEERHGFTGALKFSQLKSHTNYECSVAFGPDQSTPPEERIDFGLCHGGFRTAAADDSTSSLKFLFGSCNLHSMGVFQSPDRVYRRLGRVARTEKVDLMIHCGDQIYYDVPVTPRPTIESYREKYLDAWRDSRETRKFLTELRQYMILDDHEIINNFANDMEWRRTDFNLETVKTLALKAYREFQHIHSPGNHGNSSLHYSFSDGANQFFVLDTRSERYQRSAPPQIVSDVQMRRFLEWLTKHKDAVKFVVSSVPFVTEARKSDDKWNYFREQREQVMAHMLKHKISGVTFLTGDQHSSYHATVELAQDDDVIVIHELMSSPLNQVFKTGYGQYEKHKKTTSADGKFSYTTKLLRSEFYNEHSNAMLVTVKGREISWQVFRTKEDAMKEKHGTYQV